MSTAKAPRGEEIDTNPVFIDFEDDGAPSSGFAGDDFDEDDGFGGYFPPSSAPAEPVETSANLTEALLDLQWVDPQFSTALWGYDVRRQVRAVPDIRQAVKQILGVPVGEAPEEKVFAYGQSIADSALLEEIVEYREDPPLMKGAIQNPYATEKTLLCIERSGLTDETGRLENALQAFSLAHEVLAGEVLVKDALQTLLEGKNAVALKLLEGDASFGLVLTALAAKEHIELRKALVSISADPDALNERYLDNTDLNCEVVDLDLLWWLSQQDEFSIIKAMVFSDEPGDLAKSVASRMDEEAAWWCAMSHDPQVRALATLTPALRQIALWHSGAYGVRRSFMPTKPFNPTEFRTRIASMLLAGVAQEAVSNFVCAEGGGLPLDEAVEFIAAGYANTTIEWLSNATRIPVEPGSVQKVMEKLDPSKYAEVVQIITSMRKDLLTEYPWSMELFLTLPGTCASVTREQAVWARAYIENAIADHTTKQDVLVSILDTAPAWSGSIVSLVESLYPEAKGIPTVNEPESSYY